MTSEDLVKKSIKDLVLLNMICNEYIYYLDKYSMSIAMKDGDR
jgi:hypothetical protein